MPPRKRKPLWKSWTVIGVVIAGAAHVAAVAFPQTAPVIHALGEAIGGVIATAGGRRALNDALSK